MSAPTKEERAEFAARRTRLANQILEILTDPQNSNDLFHFSVIAGYLGPAEVVDAALARLPKANDRDGRAEFLLATAWEAMRRYVFDEAR
jgi:hypothetical protein